MPVQPGEHVSSSTTRRPVELQSSISQDDMRRRPAAAAKPLPSQPNTTLPKAESQTIRDGPLPTAAKLSRVFSLPRLGTNTNMSRENIPVIPTQRDGTVVRRKRLVRHPSRHLSSSISTSAQIFSSQHATPFTSTHIPRSPSMCVTDIAPERPTNKPCLSPAISVGDEMDEESDDPTAHYRKIRQLQMARLAKLTRHLGEEIPPELVLSSTLPTDIAEPRSLARSLSKNLRKGHQKRRSPDSAVDSQSAPALPSSCKLRKSRSLHGAEGILRLQTHGEHAVDVVDEKLPYALHPPRKEEDFLKHSQASFRGPDDVDCSLMSTPEAAYGSQDSLYPSPPTTPERSQFYGNPTELALENISNMEHKEKLDRFLGVDINTERTNQSLHPTSDAAVGIRPSLAQISSYSELEVDVQISKRTRFWRMKVGKNVMQSVDPYDIAKQLREMKAAT